jgi:hypothetical protein
MALSGVVLALCLSVASANAAAKVHSVPILKRPNGEFMASRRAQLALNAARKGDEGSITVNDYRFGLGIFFYYSSIHIVTHTISPSLFPKKDLILCE